MHALNTAESKAEQAVTDRLSGLLSDAQGSGRTPPITTVVEEDTLVQCSTAPLQPTSSVLLRTLNSTGNGSGMLFDTHSDNRQAHTCTHACTHARAREHTHTHTHTHTQAQARTHTIHTCSNIYNQVRGKLFHSPCTRPNCNKSP